MLSSETFVRVGVISVTILDAEVKLTLSVASVTKLDSNVKSIAVSNFRW